MKDVWFKVFFFLAVLLLIVGYTEVKPPKRLGIWTEVLLVASASPSVIISSETVRNYQHYEAFIYNIDSSYSIDIGSSTAMTRPSAGARKGGGFPIPKLAGYRTSIDDNVYGLANSAVGHSTISVLYEHIRR